MWPYLLSFILSILLFYISTKIKDKSFRTFIVILAIFIPCFLAGFRDVQVGKDTQHYLRLYDVACSGVDYEKFLGTTVVNSRQAEDLEGGSTLLIYALRVFNNPHIFLFIFEMLIIVPLYLGCMKIEPLKKYVWLCMLLYYFMFFNMGLNITRQFISSSLVFYGICILLSKDKHSLLKCLALVLVAFSIHKAAILALPIILLFIFLRQNKQIVFKIGNLKISLKSIKIILLFIITIVLLINSKTVGGYLFAIDGFERYIAYYNDVISLSRNYLFWQAPIVLLLIITFKSFNKNEENAPLYLTIVLLAMVFGLFGQGTQFGERISYYYKIFYIMIFPLLATKLGSEKWKKNVIAGIILYVVIFWFITFVINGYHQTIPYVLGVSF